VHGQQERVGVARGLGRRSRPRVRSGSARQTVQLSRLRA
jgi:hypothetical protein